MTSVRNPTLPGQAGSTSMTDAELEQHIEDCGRLMLECMAQGDRNQAEGWLQDMNHAIAQRSPEQVARMEAARGLLPEPCYFVTKADEYRPALLRRQAS